MMSARLVDMYEGELLENEPMSKHTTWRVGGPADKYYRPKNIADLAVFLTTLPIDEPLYWVGLGSNLLVRDGGVRGTVIATSGLLNEMSQVDDTSVRVEAGVACAKVARFTSKLAMTGAEFLAGIPGTMGGALAMNAGAFGGETWDIVESVEVLQRTGKSVTRLPVDYQIGYRAVTGPADEWFIATKLRLLPIAGLSDAQTNVEEGMKKVKSLLARRNQTQPTQQPNAGSVFRNPEGDFAARLIESSGLKGKKIGAACVSEKHANFIVNLGGATAADIEHLIEYVQTSVMEKTGIVLQREVRIIGEAKSGDGN